MRKLPLVIHVDGFGLVLLNKTCRLCLRCETLVAHKVELDRLLAGVVGVREARTTPFSEPSADRCTARRVSTSVA